MKSKGKKTITTAGRHQSKWMPAGLLPSSPAGVARDILAGVTLAAAAIPIDLGYTKIAGMPIVSGLYILLLPTVAFALFGASRHLVVGADSASAAILAAGVLPLAAAGSSEYSAYAVLLTLMVGLFLLVCRVFRLGFISNFLSRTVLVGFLTGIGVQVAISQLGDLSGIPGLAGTSLQKLAGFAGHISAIQPYTLLLAVLAFGLVFIPRLFFKKVPLLRRIPFSLVAIIGGILAVRLAPADTFAAVGAVQGGLPGLTLPAFSFEAVNTLLGPCIAIAVVIITQSAATTEVYAVRYEEPSDTNREPARRGGFASWLGYENNNAQLDCWLHGHDHDGEVDFFRLPGYETDALTDRMISYLQTRVGQLAPFFAVLSVQPPHNPYVAPPRFGRHNPAALTLRENVPAVEWVTQQARQELAGYYGMVENLDANVGRLMEALAATGQLEHTHVLFFSDHGDMHGSHGQFRKTTAYEEALRIPFILAGEKQGGHEVGRKTGEVLHALVNHVDIAPTTLGLCGIKAPAWMEGFDYSALRFLGRPLPEALPQSAYLQSVIPTGHADSMNKPWRGVVTRDGYKYVCLPGTGWLLFDLNHDPYEQVNLVHNEAYRPLRLRLLRELQGWVEKTGDKFDLPADG